jgi:hypothetical protein
LGKEGFHQRITQNYSETHPGSVTKGSFAAITGPAIVTATSKRDRIARRREEADADTEASPEIKAFFARMMRPPGS